MPSSLSFNPPPHHHHHHHSGTDHVCPWNREGANVFSQTPPFAVGRCHPIPSSPAHREDDRGEEDDNDDDGDDDDDGYDGDDGDDDCDDDDDVVGW